MPPKIITRSVSEMNLKCPFCKHSIYPPSYPYCRHTIFVYCEAIDSGFDFVTKEFAQAYLDMLKNEKSIPLDEKEFSPEAEKAFLNGSHFPFHDQEIMLYEELLVKLPLLSDSTVIKVTEKDNKDYPGTLIVGFREG